MKCFDKLVFNQWPGVVATARRNCRVVLYCDNFNPQGLSVENNIDVIYIIGGSKRVLRMRALSRSIFTARKRSLRRLCFYTCLSVHGGGREEVCVLSQHALQVVSQHALQQVSRGWYPSIPCRFPGPHPEGKLRGIWSGQGAVSGPQPRRKLRGNWPGGSPGPHPGGACSGGGVPAQRGVCSKEDPTGMHSCLKNSHAVFFGGGG